SAVQHMQTRLTKDGEGFRLTGYKNYVTSGHVASACLVWTRFPESKGANGIGSVIVDLQRPGVKVTGIHKKMGLRGNAEAELAFDDVRVEPDEVLVRGEPDNVNAFRSLLCHLNHERCGNASMCGGHGHGPPPAAHRLQRDGRRLPLARGTDEWHPHHVASRVLERGAPASPAWRDPFEASAPITTGSVVDVGPEASADAGRPRLCF